ncbi:MAG: carbohydrate-binding protein [Ruminococcus sp.]|nr:carbohydrate-binding protein [Ruminococcus sp.]
MNKNKRSKRLAIAVASAMLGLNLCTGFNSSAADGMYYGDADHNGIVDLTDLTICSQYLLRTLDFTPQEMTLMDVDQNSTVNLSDLATLKRYIMNKIQGNTIIGTLCTEFEPQVTEPIVTEATTPPVTTAETTTTTEVTTPEPPKEMIYYGCDGQIFNGITETVNGGFLGQSYVNFDNVMGSSLTFTVNAPSDGNYELTVRFANGTTAARPLNVFVNGSNDSYFMNFDGTGAWTDWSENKIVVSLKQGENKIKMVATTSNGGPNVDLIKLIATDKPADELNKNSVIPYEPPVSPGSKQVERLERALSAVNTGNGMLVSWRSLGTDPADTTFKLYKDGSLIYTSGAGEATTYLDNSGSSASKYSLETYINGTLSEVSERSVLIGGEYLELRLNKPSSMRMPDGSTCEYTASDCSTADVNGDGKLEIILKWDPTNAQDNSKAGYTGNVYIDCYTLEGKQLWRIDLGKNIRAGAHYTQFMVYDFDGNGKAEMICKTADGTVDGTGRVIGDGSKDYRSQNGYILNGPEYLSVFNGETGAVMDTINYNPPRGNSLKQTWGDDYGNRVDRFLAGVAYLDGKKPSVVMCRGYYTRATIAAYDWNGSKLTQRWFFDSYDGGTDKQGKPNSSYSGQGNHNLTITDVDGDGYDEIIYGSCTIDHDGKGLYSMNLGHGDAIHVSDFIPSRPGLEVWLCHEVSPYGCTLSDAATGQIIFRYTADKDTGRACAANILPGNDTAEFWGARSGDIYDGYGKVIGSSSKLPSNFVIHWDGDLESELLDGAVITKYTANGVNTMLAPSGVVGCNSTKNTPNLTADLFGDWREELVVHTEDSSALRIYSTTHNTDIRTFTFMHDIQYRTSVAAENTAYNQPPHTSFFLGTGYKLPGYPQVYYAK